MTKIEHLLQMPVGQGTGGYTLYVKTFKKRWEGSECWWQSCICKDDSGEILVEVRLATNAKLSRTFHVRTGLIEETDWLGKPRKTLTVFEYTEPTQTADDYMEQADIKFEGEMNKVRGMVRHGLSCAFIKRVPEIMNPTEPLKKAINRWVEFIITGT